MATARGWFDDALTPGRHVGVAVGAIVLYLAADVATPALEFWPDTAALFLPAGVAVALLVGLGPGHAVTVMVAMLLAGSWPAAPDSLPGLGEWAVLATGVYAGTAWLLRERTRFDPSFRRFSDGVRFSGWYLLAALVVGFAAAVIRSGGAQSGWQLVVRTTAFWIGDAAAILSLGPFLLLWVLPRLREGKWGVESRRRLGPLEAVLQAAVVAFVFAIFAVERVRLVRDPSLFLLFPPMLWIVARSGLAVAMAATALLTMGAAVTLSLMESLGPALILSSVLIVLSTTALLLGASLRERDRVRDQLETREGHLARAEQVAHLGSWIWEMSSGECTWTRQLYVIHGRPEHQPVGPTTYLEYVVEEDRERVRQTVAEAVEAPRGFTMEYTLMTDQGTRRRVVTRAAVEVDEEGQAVRVTGTCHDVTEARLAEEETLRTGRFEALGRLVTDIAHDLNNYLTVIKGNAGLLSRGDDQDAESLDEIDRTVERARVLNQRLLDFARGSSLEPETVDLSRELADHEWIIRRMVGGGITLVLELDPELPEVSVERIRLEQVLNNLVVNASQAVGDGGTVRIRTRTVPPPRGTSGDPWAALDVVDDGCGIPEEALEKIFEPFFTTRGGQGGTGLGLAMVDRIVQGFGGTVEVRSRPDQGTTFTILLPPAAGDGSQSPPSSEADPRGA